MENKKENKIKKVLTWKLPWVMTNDEMKALEQKSPLWYLATGPIRLINMLPAPIGTSRDMRMAILPVALLVLAAIFVLEKLGLLPLYK